MPLRVSILGVVMEFTDNNFFYDFNIPEILKLSTINKVRFLVVEMI